MITPEDRAAGLSMSALLTLQSLGGETPEPIASRDKNSLSGRLARLGWKLLPIPMFYQRGIMWTDASTGEVSPAVIRFKLVREWVIVPPEGSPIRARKVEGKVRAIRAAYALALHGEESPVATGEA